MRITTRNARFQVWSSLLTNRSKRSREGAFLVQGVRPITLAIEHGWSVRTVLQNEGGTPSRWARDLLGRVPGAERVSLATELIAELGEKEEGAPELVLVVDLPPDDLDRVPIGPDFLGVAFDRPSQPGNIGAVLRSADAFGASGVITTGHAADLYDPRSVRASTGSLFAVPAVRAESHRDVLARLDRADERPVVVGTDEHGDADLEDLDLARPTLLVIGNETRGLSAGWLESVDVLARIPMAGAASSLNASNAASIALYETARQRRRGQATGTNRS